MGRGRIKGNIEMRMRNQGGRERKGEDHEEEGERNGDEEHRGRGKG